MNRKGVFALVALVVACIGLFVVPVMAKAAAPEVSLQQAAGQVDPTNDPSITFTLTSNEPLDGASVTASDFTITNGSLDGITEVSPAQFDIAVTADNDGSVDIAPSGTFEVTDVDETLTTTTAQGADRSVTYDGTAPELVLDAASDQDDPTDDPEIRFVLSGDEELDLATVGLNDFEATNGDITSLADDAGEVVITVEADAQGDVDLDPSGTFSVSDVVGNAATALALNSASVLYDTAPVITVDQANGQADPTNTAAIDFTLSGNEDLDGGTIEGSDFDVTNGSFTGAAADGDDFTITVDATAEGAVTITPSGTFSVSDTNGNFAATTFTSSDATVTFDSVAPTASIDDNPSDPSFDPTPTFGIASTEGGSTFECRLWESSDTPPSFDACLDPYNSAFLPEGDYNFEVRATDVAGNTGNTASYNWARQQSELAAGPEEAVYFTRGDTPVEFKVVTEDDQAGEFSYEFLNALGGGTVGEFTVDDQANSGTATYTPGDGFAGEDILNVRVTNNATGGEVETQVHILIRPVSKLNTGPGVSTPQLTNDPTPTFSYSAVSGPNEGVISGATFACKIDGAAMSNSACNTGSITTANLSDGPHTFTVRASKPSINPDSTLASVTFTVDTGIPGIPTVNGPEGLTNDNSLSWSYTVPEGVAECRIISAGDPDPAFSTCGASPIEVNFGTDGEKTLEVRTRDNAGNVSAAVSKTVVVDTSVEVTIDSAPTDGNLDALPAIEFSSPEDPDVDYECRLYPSAAAPGDIPEYTSCESPEQLAFLDRNISYRFDVRGTDPAGNTDVATAEWLQSNTAPAIDEPTVTLEAGTTATVDFGGSDADSDVITYAVTGEVTGGDLGEIDQGTGLADFTADENAAGEYAIAYSVTDDRQGGTTSGVATILVQPNTFITSETAAEINDATPTIEFDSPADSVDTFECSLDGGPWEDCDSGSYTPASDLGEGPHTVAVRATKSGLADPTPDSVDFIVDLTAPDVSITDTPVALSNNDSPEFTFETTDPTATFECSIDEGDFAPCLSGDPLTPALADGDHLFAVRSVDPAGNESIFDSYLWEVDLTEPEIELTSGPLTDDWTNARRPFWEFTETDLNLVPESTRCQVDAQGWVDDCLSPWQPASNLNDGMHTVTFETSDGAGNVESVEHTFRVTTITPTVVVDDGPDSPSGPSASFSFSSTTDLGEHGKFECRISINAGTYSPWEECDGELTLEDLSSGSRTLQVRAVDSAGNHSVGAAVGTWSWNTVGGSPDTVITGQTLNGSTAAFGFNSPANPLATFECRIDNGAWAACSSPKSFAGLGTGAHTFNVRSTNQVGTIDETPATHTWSVSAVGPPDTSIGRKPAASTTLTGATFEFSSSEAVATFECRIDGGAWEACESPKSYSGLAVADHSFDVRSTSGGRTDPSPASAAWKVIAAHVDPSDPPVCNAVAPAASKSKAMNLGRKLRVAVQISHSRAITDQMITAKLLVNGKAPKGKALKGASKALKGVDIAGSSGIVASLQPRKATATFEAGADTASNLRVLVKRKQGKALRSSVAFTLQSCDQ